MDKKGIKDQLRSVGEKTLTLTRTLVSRSKKALDSSPQGRKVKSQLEKTFGGTQEFFSENLKKKDFAFYGKLITIALSTYFLSDVTSLLIEEWIPEGPVVSSRATRTRPS